jgi:type IX secretion system PorP/SprF family membrane protein
MAMKKTIFLILFYITFQSLIAQDHQFSVFSSSPLTINPATTGTFGNSNLRVNAGFDWISYSGLFHGNTISLSADKAILKGKLGVGGDVSYETGNDVVKSKSAKLSAAYNTGFLNDNFKFSVGVQACLMHSSIDWDQLIFEDALSPRYGEIYFEFAEPAKEHILYSDFNLGVLVFRNTDKSKIMPWIGLSVSHLFRPDVSFLSQSNPMPRKLTIHAGADIPVDKHVVLTPLLLFTEQDEYKVLDIGGTAKYQQGSISFSLGGLYNEIHMDFSKIQQACLLAEIGYSGFELRLELLVIKDKYPRQMSYSRGIAGLSWNLQQAKK